MWRRSSGPRARPRRSIRCWGCRRRAPPDIFLSETLLSKKHGLPDVSGLSALDRSDRSAALTSSVHADGLQFISPGIRDRGFARIGQHDRGAVGGMEREQFQSGRDLRRLRKQVRHVFGSDLLYVGYMALAEAS